MKRSSDSDPRPDLSVAAQQSPLGGFARRVMLSMVLVPALGYGLGTWLDRQWPGQVSWGMAFLFLAICLGCANTWFWLKQPRP
ncbi:MAG: hypothetical protein HC922_02005 [Leptolyngbyaceae cyanobacterium SM2_3_12]|nr:hypothetical protein [Leptolyngbyaceae cyanobacterium SM2_3_12]